MFLRTQGRGIGLEKHINWIPRSWNLKCEIVHELSSLSPAKPMLLQVTAVCAIA